MGHHPGRAAAEGRLLSGAGQRRIRDEWRAIQGSESEESTTHPPPADDALRAQALCRRYDGGPVVFEDLSFAVEKGELLCVMGSNGSGKTTLLRLLAGLDAPSGGTVTRRGTVRLMFQENDLFPWLTVRGNLLLGQRSSSLDRATYEAKMRHYLDLVGLADRQDAYPHQLSGGNRQRVAIVRCFLSGADILLLDEPFAHLDPVSRAQLQELVRQLWREESRTVIVVTHDVAEALALATRVLVLTGPRSTVLLEGRELDAERRSGGAPGGARLLSLLEQQGAPVEATEPRRARRRRLRLDYLLSPLLLLALWEHAATHAWIDTRFFPAPSAILEALRASFESGQMQTDIAASLRRLAWGTVLGGGAGLLLGVLMGVHRVVRIAFEPLIALAYPLPKIAILPLLLVVFGVGEASKIVTLSIGAFFLVQMNTLHGVDEVTNRFGDTIRSLGLRGWDFYGRALLRGALPSVLVGVRAAVGYCLVLLVAAEFTGSDAGVGYAIWHAWELFNIEPMYAGLLMLALFGLLLFFVLDEWLARIPWRHGRDTEDRR